MLFPALSMLMVVWRPNILPDFEELLLFECIEKIKPQFKKNKNNLVIVYILII